MLGTAVGVAVAGLRQTPILCWASGVIVGIAAYLFSGIRSMDLFLYVDRILIWKPYVFSRAMTVAVFFFFEALIMSCAICFLIVVRENSSTKSKRDVFCSFSFFSAVIASSASQGENKATFFMRFFAKR